MGVFDVIGSVMSGGLTGLIGAGITQFVDFQKAKLQLVSDKQKQDFELAVKDKDALIMAQEWAARTKVAEVEAADHQAVAAEASFAAALTSEPKRYAEGLLANSGQAWMMFLLDFLRGAVRPGLTIYLCAITTAVYVHSRMLIVDGSVTSTDALALVNRIVDTVLYLTTTCTLFWFGTRNQQKPPKF